MGGMCSTHEEMMEEYKILDIKLNGKISLREIWVLMESIILSGRKDRM